MRKKLMMLLPLFMVFFAVKANAQELYEGTYFNVETPSAAWMMVPTETEFDGETINLIKLKGEALDMTLLILSMKDEMDPETFLAAQLEDPTVSNASEITEGELMGQPTLAATFRKDLQGTKYEADGIVMVIDGILYYFMSYGEENDGNIEDLIEIMNSFTVHQ